jgi:hypothetical protein
MALRYELRRCAACGSAEVVASGERPEWSPADVLPVSEAAEVAAEVAGMEAELRELLAVEGFGDVTAFLGRRANRRAKFEAHVGAVVAEMKHATRRPNC